ncbi:Alpha/Beta hydrolase protein [Halteromyces radiatus]|uniref:Alpha/Beta hydrolase protein n=1 Tax=Halteromyces radiatus TaxID=101107 RepID=UPI00221F1289|nr:Alpha/Beta hydrolase protein [Halteromyces radiatus]KAI8089447.1 Alpha/Beta hydrolase protein [Halteromyces radiatus]
MLFSKFSLLGVFGLFASTHAFDLQQVLQNGQQQQEQWVTTDDFRILTSDNAKGYQVRIKVPQTCEQGVQYSGYIDNLDHDDHYFFMFFESRSSPKEDPTVLWLNGGPGCSSFMGNVMELGPCLVTKDGNDTVSNPYSWNSVSNIIFLDQPVRVGYSYGKSTVKTTAESARDVYAFLQIFFTEFKQYAQNSFHITGESYAGHYLPALAVEIINKNKFAEQQGRFRIPFESMAIGNGFTDPRIQFKHYQTFGCAKNESKYQPIFDDKTCAELENAYPKCYGLMTACYRYPSSLTCVPASLYCEKSTGMGQYTKTGLNPYDIRMKCEGNTGLCYELMEAIDNYANLEKVRTNLGVDPAAGKYSGCTDSVGFMFGLTGDGAKNFEPHVSKTLSEGIRVLLYAGDKDFICNWMGNKAWSLSMDWPGQEGYNNADDEEWINAATGESAGQVRTYKNLSFLRVYDAGHMVPYDQPANALDFISRWLSNQSLNQ